MYETPKDIPELDLERHMNDHASRVQMNSLGHKRIVVMQKLLLKIQGMNDKDFDTAYTTLESVVDNLSKKPLGSEDKDKGVKKNLSTLITK